MSWKGYNFFLRLEAILAWKKWRWCGHVKSQTFLELESSCYKEVLITGWVGFLRNDVMIWRRLNCILRGRLFENCHCHVMEKIKLRFKLDFLKIRVVMQWRISNYNSRLRLLKIRIVMLWRIFNNELFYVWMSTMA